LSHAKLDGLVFTSYVWEIHPIYAKKKIVLHESTSPINMCRHLVQTNY